MSRTAVFQTAFLGDIVLTTPLIQTIAKHHGPVTVITTPENAPLVETLPTVDDVIIFDKRGTDRGPRGLLQTAQRLRRRNLDLAYLPHESLRSALLAKLAGIPMRVGFAGAPGAWLYTERRRATTGQHESERLNSLANDDAVCPPMHIALTDADRHQAAKELTGAGIEGEYIVLAPGSRRATKRWPYFPELAQLLTIDRDVVFVGGTDDRDRGWAMPNLAGKLSIRETAAVMERACLVVCNDSVALHLAGAVNTPVAAIFGPTHPSLGFGPRGSSDIVIGKTDLDCRPCSTHGGDRCPLRHHRCMVDLAVKTVAQNINYALRAEAKQSCGQ